MVIYSPLLPWLLSVAVPLAYGTLRERRSKLRAASRREVLRPASPALISSP
ncbi:MAG: hypothetical protein V7K26_30645 [Nostoc sp.]